jgi:hypothetical protein
MRVPLFPGDMQTTAKLNGGEIRRANPILASESPFIHG